MTAIIIICGLIIIAILLMIANLSDRVERLEAQVRKQEHHIEHNKMVINMVAEDVYDKKQ